MAELEQQCLVKKTELESMTKEYDNAKNKMVEYPKNEQKEKQGSKIEI